MSSRRSSRIMRGAKSIIAIQMDNEELYEICLNVGEESAKVRSFDCQIIAIDAMPIISVSSLVNVLHGHFTVSMGRILLAAGTLSMAVADSDVIVWLSCSYAFPRLY